MGKDYCCRILIKHLWEVVTILQGQGFLSCISFRTVSEKPVTYEETIPLSAPASAICAVVGIELGLSS